MVAGPRAPFDRSAIARKQSSSSYNGRSSVCRPRSTNVESITERVLHAVRTGRVSYGCVYMCDIVCIALVSALVLPRITRARIETGTRRLVRFFYQSTYIFAHFNTCEWVRRDDEPFSVALHAWFRLQKLEATSMPRTIYSLFRYLYRTLDMYFMVPAHND